MAADERCQSLAFSLCQDQFDGRRGSKGNPVHAGTVKGVNERPSISDQQEAVTGERGTIVRKILSPVDVPLAALRISHDFAAGRMSDQEIFQTLPERAVLGPFNEPL